MSDRSLLVFVHINKTAGTTLRQILRSSYGARHCDVEPWHGPWQDPPFSTPDLRRVRRLYPRLASIAGHRVTGYADLEEPGTEMRYLTFLREPISMCASRFQYQIDYRKKERVFEDWIRNDWVRDAQTQRIGGTTNAADAIATIEKREMFVGLTERFDESMVLVRALVAPDLDIRYERANVAKSSRIAKDLLSDPVSRRMIEEANQADLELYEHVVRELYPGFQRAYGEGLEEAVARLEHGPHGFRRRKLATYGLKQRLVHRPALRLYRSGWDGGLARRLLG
ncbi:MAG TPA: hypothetical protein VFT80_05665 [Actinomycetota bacterium]|nr:hypothetical protein [Actinomycetota bacterium]